MVKTDRQLSSAEVRRAEVVRAASAAFAQRGYYGTSTTEIAEKSGISQAYLYRLFSNKEALFIAVLADVKLRLRQSIADAADVARREHPEKTGREFLRDVSAKVSRQPDPHSAMVLLHASAAVGEPEILTAVIDCYRDQVAFLREVFLASDEDIHWFIATAQLENNLAALHLDATTETWASAVMTPAR